MIRALLLLALSGPPAVDPPPVPVYGFAVVEAPAEAGDRVAFTVHPTPVQRIDRGAETIFSGPPGAAYTVSWTVVNFKAERFLTGGITVRFAGAKPAPAPDVKPRPGPKPKPTPDPTPAPKATAVRVILLFDAADVSPETARLKGDLPFWKSLSDRGYVFRMYSTIDADAAPYVADAKAPAVILYDHATPAKPLAVLPLPATVADIQMAIAKVTK